MGCYSSKSKILERVSSNPNFTKYRVGTRFISYNPNAGTNETHKWFVMGKSENRATALKYFRRYTEKYYVRPSAREYFAYDIILTTTKMVDLFVECEVLDEVQQFREIAVVGC